MIIFTNHLKRTSILRTRTLSTQSSNSIFYDNDEDIERFVGLMPFLYFLPSKISHFPISSFFLFCYCIQCVQTFSLMINFCTLHILGLPRRDPPSGVTEMLFSKPNREKDISPGHLVNKWSNFFPVNYLIQQVPLRCVVLNLIFWIILNQGKIPGRTYLFHDL